MPSRSSIPPLPHLLVTVAAFAQLACSDPVAPNLVLITLDTLRADRLGSYGYDRDTTPTLDAIAARGVRFEDAITQATTTTPSHASILTGLNPARHGLRRLYQRLASSNHTLAEILKGEGYSTAAFVSAVPLRRKVGLDQGFDHYSDHNVDSAGAGSDDEKHYRPARATNERVYEWLEDRPRGPLFLWVHYFDPHTPYFAPEEFRRRYGVEKTRLRFQHPSVDTNQMRPNGEPRQRPKPKTVERMSNLYDAEIRYMDTAIGELLAALGEAGLLENSVVAFVADHGEHFGEGGYYFGHWDVLDETARVPMVIAHADGRHRGSVVEQSVGTIDLVPTLLAWMEIETPLAFDGVDLTPLIRGDPVPTRALYTEQFEYFPVRAARSGPWMLRQQAQPDQPVGQGQQRLLRRTSRGPDAPQLSPDGLARLSRALDALARPSSHHESESLAVPDAAREQLRALGYTNEASAAEP